MVLSEYLPKWVELYSALDNNLSTYRGISTIILAICDIKQNFLELNI